MPSYGSDIPANQPELDAAVQLVGDAPQSMTVAIDNPDGRLAFGTDAPSPTPTTQPSSPVATQPTTQPFTLPGDHSWVHLSVFGISQSATINDAFLRVTASIAGRVGGVVLSQKGASVFWFTNARMDVVPDTAYQLQGGVYAPPNQAPAIDLSAAATLEPGGLDPTAPQLAKLRLGIAQNVGSDYLANVYGTPQMAWNANYPDGTPINPGAQVTVSSQVAQSVDSQLNGATYPLLDTAIENPSPAPLYDKLGLSLGGWPGGNPDTATADAFDAPQFPVPAVQGPAFKPVVPVVDNKGLVGYATYTQLIKTIRQNSFTDWCVVVDISAGTKVLAPLAQNEWDSDLDSSVGNQLPTGGQSHIPTANPVLHDPTANSLARQVGATDIYGPGNVTFTK